MSDVSEDAQLLEEFVRNGSQQAFAVMVSRYIDLVYAAALRQVRQPQAAEDVSQIVFATLARKAPLLRKESVLAAWLLRTTRYTCLDLLKREARRKRREKKVADMRPQIVNPAIDDQLCPLLDEALAALSDRDRRVVVMKYFSQVSDRDSARRLGITETTLRQRRFRSLERMRNYLHRRGVEAPADVLAGVMAAAARVPAPAHLAGAATSHALAAAAGVTVAGVKGVLIMAWIKTNAAIVATIVFLLLCGAGFLIAGRIRGREPMAIAVQPRPALARIVPPTSFAPGERIPARAYSMMHGAQELSGGIGYLDTGTWLRYSNVDFGQSSGRLRVSLAVPADRAGKQIVVRLDKRNGPVVARLTVKSTGGWNHLEVQETPLSAVTGVHDIYLSFTGSGVANLYWLSFVPAAPTDHHTPTTMPSAPKVRT